MKGTNMNQWWVDFDGVQSNDSVGGFCLVIGRPSQGPPKKKRRNHPGKERGSPVADKI